MSFIFLADELTMGLGVDVVLDDDEEEDDLSAGETGIDVPEEPALGLVKVVSVDLVLVVLGEQFTKPIKAVPTPNSTMILFFIT